MKALSKPALLGAFLLILAALITAGIGVRMALRPTQAARYAEDNHAQAHAKATYVRTHKDCVRFEHIPSMKSWDYEQKKPVTVAGVWTYKCDDDLFLTIHDDEDQP